MSGTRLDMSAGIHA